jgi:hypothetical protein
MKIFDGTKPSSVIKSLSKVLELSPEQLPDLISNCVLLDIHNKNLCLQDFFTYCQDSNIILKTTDLHFDRVMFFHKTSFIDNGAFIREKGLRDLDELLIHPSPLKEYLNKKGVEFFFDENEILSININGEKQKLKDLSCTKMKYPKPRIVARLTKFQTQPLEGITGFLFLEDEKNANAYHQRINKNFEFLEDLEDCIGGIADEWRNLSKPAILKCKVDIESWHKPTDIFEEENELEKSYEIADQGFRFLAEAYQYFPGDLRDHNYYPHIAHGVGIPPNRIRKFSKLS